MQAHSGIQINVAAAAIATLFIVEATICTQRYANAAGAASAPAATATPAQLAKTKQHTARAPVFANPATIGDAPTGSTAPEQELTEAEKKALIKESQNPVGNIAILPFQNNWLYGTAATGTTVWNMNIQPVVPFMLSPKANLIERVITPVINVTPLLSESDCFALGITSSTPCGAQLGIGNIQLQSYYAPKTNPTALIWGAGPIFSFPTVTHHLGTQQFGGGINAVGLVMPGSWVMGMLVTQRWYIAGPSAPAQSTLNSFLAQPFINYNFGKGWTLTEAPIITANWNQPGDQKWTVPIGLQISNTNTWLKQPMTYALAYYGNVVRPQDSPHGTIRFNWAILWPVKRGR